MKYGIVLLVCIAAVNAQSARGPPPSRPPPAVEGKPIIPPEQEIAVASSAAPSAMPAMKQSPVVTIPAEPTTAPKPRPKGCSPGCGPSEICAELGRSYCRPGQGCSVCIKMSSIRFPASAVYSMFQPKPAVPQITLPNLMMQNQAAAPAQPSNNMFMQMPDTQPVYDTTPVQQQDPVSSSAFSYSPQIHHAQAPPANIFPSYDTQPQQTNNNLDIFGFPIQQQQSSNSGFNSMMPFLWMGDMGFGF